jgi:hypothetical protein
MRFDGPHGEAAAIAFPGKYGRCNVEREQTDEGSSPFAASKPQHAAPTGNLTDLPRARGQRFTANYLRLKNLPSDNG